MFNQKYYKMKKLMQKLSNWITERQIKKGKIFYFIEGFSFSTKIHYTYGYLYTKQDNLKELCTKLNSDKDNQNILFSVSDTKSCLKWREYQNFTKYGELLAEDFIASIRKL